MTGKAAELAAILLQLPVEQDFFKRLESDFVQDGQLGSESRRWVADMLRNTPLLITQEELRETVERHRQWHTEQVAEVEKLDAAAAAKKTDTTFASLFAGWRDPVLSRAISTGRFVEERGVPLRAMLGYLFAEVAKNFYLIHHPDEWIEWVSRSQRGDRCFEIDPDGLPDVGEMLSPMDWERGLSGAPLMELWLERCGAMPFDFNRGLGDDDLSSSTPPELHRIEGSNFFRGLALIDLIEAMLKRAFGRDAVAVRVNAAGQGDFFQVHVDTEKAGLNAVKDFVRQAFYRRFGLTPEEEFVEPHPGGGALGVRLERFQQLPDLVRALGRVPPAKRFKQASDRRS